ncbi:MAG: hypothetical protein NVSMB57_01240 [Actinomycetota bacterium]
MNDKRETQTEGAQGQSAQENGSAATSRKKMSRAEAGRKGGKRTSERYGSDFFRQIGRIGGSKTGTGIRRDFGQSRNQDQETSVGGA